MTYGDITYIKNMKVMRTERQPQYALDFQRKRRFVQHFSFSAPSSHGKIFAKLLELVQMREP